MDQAIRELQRKAAQGDEQAASMFEADLKRIGRHALMFREQVNKDADPIESIQDDFDTTLIRRKMGKGWSSIEIIWWVYHPRTLWAMFYSDLTLRFITVRKGCFAKPRLDKRKAHNSKRKTLRTHRNGRARR